jgi:serine/threonine protein kinase
MQTAAGLAAAHAQGLVHRDVKPSNILLEQGVERALLTDFGLARASDDASLTHTGYHPGTPQYMSPEQARGESVDARSDLFSLGSVMYTMCTGRPAFRADTNYGVLRRITDNEPRPIREINPAIPDWLEAIVARLHCKSPGNRLASADQVHDLLEHCLAHVQHPTSVPLPPAVRKLIADSSGPQTGHPHVRKLALTLTCLTAAGLLLGPGQHFFNANHSNPQPPDSTQAPASEQPTATAQPSTTEQPTAAQPPHRSHDANPQTAWDGPATDISSYHRELSDFEARSQLPWDKLPAANDQPTTTQQTPPDDR